MGGKNKTGNKESAIAKGVNKNLVPNVKSYNTDRPVNSTADNIMSLSWNNSAEVRAENDAFPLVTAHRFQNAQ